MIDITVTGNTSQRLGEIIDLGRRADSAISGITRSTGTLIATFVGFHTISNALTGVITNFSDLQEQMFDISKTTGLTGSGLKSLTDKLDKLSTTTRGMEVSSLYEISAIAGQLGIQGKKDILEFTTEIKKLSVTSSLTAEEAGNSFAQLLNALNLATPQVRNLSATFTALASTTTVSEKGLVDYVQRLAGAGKTIGLTTAQIAGLGATLKDVGLSAELSTTAISQLLIKFLTDTKTITKALKIDYTSFAKMVKDQPNKALETFLVTLGKLDKTAKVKALKDMKLAGAGLSSTLLKLSSNTNKLTKNIDTANKAFKAGTATEQEFNIVSQSLKAKQEQLTSQIKLTSYALGKELEPSLVSVIDGLMPMIKFVQQNSSQMIKYAKFVTSVSVAWKGLNFVMSMSPFGRIIAGITAIIALAIKAYKTIKRMMNAYKSRKEALKDYLKDVNVEARANKEKLNQYNKLIKQSEVYNRSIKATAKLLESKDLSVNTRATLEKNLALQGKKYVAITLQSQELKKQLQLKKQLNKPNPQPNKITQKIDVIKHENTTVTEVKDTIENKKLNVNQHVTTTGDKIIKQAKDKTKDTLRKERAIQEKQARQLKAHLKEQARIREDFLEDYNKTTLSQYQYDLMKLNESYNHYEGVVKDKAKLDKWYNTEKKKLIKEKDDRTLRKAITESERVYKVHLAQIKTEVKARDKAFQRRREQEKQIAQEQREYLQGITQSLSESLTSGEWDFSAMNQAWTDNINELSKTLSDILTEALTTKGKISTESIQKLTTTGIQGVSGMINQSILNSVSGQEFQSNMVQGGQLLGTAIGNALGGPIGGAIGSVVVGGISKAISGSGISQSVSLNNNGDLSVNETNDKGVFGSSTRELIEETRKLSLAYQKNVEIMNDVGKQLNEDFVYSTKNFIQAGYEYSSEQMQTQLNRALFASITGYNDALTAIYDKYDTQGNSAKDKAKRFALEQTIRGSATSGFQANINQSAIQAMGITDAEIADLKAFQEQTAKLRHEWELIAESSNMDVTTLLQQSISSLQALNEQVHTYSFNQKELLEYNLAKSTAKVKEVQEILKVAETEFGTITLENFEAFNQSIIKSGTLTPELTRQLQLLGSQLIASADASSQLEQIEANRVAKELAEAEAKAKKEQEARDRANENYRRQAEANQRRWEQEYKAQQARAKQAEIERQQAVRNRASQLSVYLEQNKQLELTSKIYLLQYKRANKIKKVVEDTKDLELERLNAVKEALQENIDAINKSLDSFRVDSSTGKNADNNDSRLVAFNESLNAIKFSGETTQEGVNELVSNLTSSLADIKSLADSGRISNTDVTRYVNEAKEALKDITVTPEKITDTLPPVEVDKNTPIIIQAVEKALANDDTIKEVDNSQLGTILTDLDLNYVQTSQLMKAFSDNILTADELLNIKGLSPENLKYIEDITKVDTEKFKEIDSQIDYLNSIKDENMKQNEKLEQLEYLFAINAEEVRASRSVLEDILDK